MIAIRRLRVHKANQCLCSVPELDVSQGQRLAVLGDNGSGKTTLLKVLAGLEMATEGRCDVALPLNQRVYVHQSPLLLRGSVLDSVTYGLRVRKVPRREARARAMDCLGRLGLAELSQRPINGLSGGEVRRVALARSLVIDPQLLLLDEPFADLDENGIGLVRSVLAELQGTTMLFASPTPLPPGVTNSELRLPTNVDPSL